MARFKRLLVIVLAPDKRILRGGCYSIHRGRNADLGSTGDVAGGDFVMPFSIVLGG
jgi:hypothetical protein